MKKIFLWISLTANVAFSGYSQTNTHQGTGTASLGSYNSFFGYFAGSATTSGSSNTFFGQNSGRSNTTGRENVGVGGLTLKNSDYAIQNTAVGFAAMTLSVSGSRNVAIGYSALLNNTTDNNVAVGTVALFSNTIGTNNVGVGTGALYENRSGASNTAMGSHALHDNEAGYHNTALGYDALYYNTSDRNTAVGSQSLFKNTSGNNNTATGYGALYENTLGYFNTAIGYEAMLSNTHGNFNSATGYYALHANTTGTHNTSDGFRSLSYNSTGTRNTAAGAFALYNNTIGTYNSAFGYNSGPALNDLTNTTALGYLAVPTASNQVRIGNSFVTSIGGQVEWTAFSDGRFKKDVKEDVSGLEFITKLRPVSYTVDKEGLNKFLHVSDSSSNKADTKSFPDRETGFIAQEVEALVKKTGIVFSGIDEPENENDPYGIRYAAFVVPLVKAVQELTDKLEAQERKAEEQEQKIESLLNERNGQTDVGSALLLQNNPNPFNAETEIKMTLPETIGQATLMIYNLEGKQIKSILVAERGETGVKIKANELAAGMYLYTLIADGKALDTKRMILTQR